MSRIREEGREAARQKRMTSGIVEGGMGSNMKSAWQVEKWEGTEGGRELAEHVENSGQNGGSVWL